jgi:hypothetical protein
MNEKPTMKRTISPEERVFLDSIIVLEARLRSERLTPEALAQMLELTGKAKEHAQKKEWEAAHEAVRQLQKKWSKLPRRWA